MRKKLTPNATCASLRVLCIRGAIALVLGSANMASAKELALYDEPGCSDQWHLGGGGVEYIPGGRVFPASLCEETQVYNGCGDYVGCLVRCIGSRGDDVGEQQLFSPEQYPASECVGVPALGTFPGPSPINLDPDEPDFEILLSPSR